MISKARLLKTNILPIHWYKVRVCVYVYPFTVKYFETNVIPKATKIKSWPVVGSRLRGPP